jgi:transcriptional regulator with XRE-family HTH domain
MVAAPGDAPAVARHRVRRALREARDGTEMSQGDVARRLGWSLSKMQRIEAGEVGVSPTDLRALLDVYGVDDPARIDRLVEYARTSRRQRYVTPSEHREHLTPAMIELMQFERQATAINTYQPAGYPGSLQTPAVAESILDFWSEIVTEDERRVRFEARMERRKSLVEEPEGPECNFILDQSVLKQRIRDLKVTAEQLEDTVEVARLPRVHLRIVPFGRSAYLPGLGAFVLLHLDGESGRDALLYQEGVNEDRTTSDPGEIAFYSRMFEKLKDNTMSEEASLRALVAEAALLRTELDQEVE